MTALRGLSLNHIDKFLGKHYICREPPARRSSQNRNFHAGRIYEQVYEALRSIYGIYLTLSGGDWKDRLLRIGHMGNLTNEDYDDLVAKLREELI